MLTKRQRRALQRAYAKLVAHDLEGGADEYVDEASAIISRIIGKRATDEADRWVEEEYSGSGMEVSDEDS